MSKMRRIRNRKTLSRHRGIHVVREYIMRMSDVRAERRVRNVRNIGGIHTFRYHGERCRDAVKMRHWDRLLKRRYGY